MSGKANSETGYFRARRNWFSDRQMRLLGTLAFR